MPQNQSPETAALNDLLRTINNPNIQGVEVPPEEELAKDLSKDIAKLRRQQADAKVKELETELKKQQAVAKAKELDAALQSPIIETPPTPPAAALKPSKLFFTGRLKAGKDTSAAAAGATIFGFADPLYAIAEYFFGVKVNATEGKDLPGMREFLQVVGQWGRAVITDKYPLTTNRASFCYMIREHIRGITPGVAFPEVVWETFGHNPNIWLDACIKRANAHIAAHPGARVAITNCRFENEFKALQADGWTHWHCMCSPKTWTERLAQSKLTPDSPAVKDLSESLAQQLDLSVTKQISAAKTGPRLRCIWSDRGVASPSERLHSPESFLQSLGIR